MALFKVKIEQGAFINDTLYREGEIIELPKGTNPNWGVRCEEDGTELENMSEKIRNRSKLNEHLAKSIEGDGGKALQSMAKENAELKASLESVIDQVAKLTKAISEGTSKDEGQEDTPAQPEMPDEVKTQVSEAVELLEDANDDQWTARGEPKLDVLKDLTGLDLSRSDVDSANQRRREKQ